MLSPVEFPVLPLMGRTFPFVFDLVECVVMYLTLMLDMNVKLQNFSKRAIIGIKNFESLFQNLLPTL